MCPVIFGLFHAVRHVHKEPAVVESIGLAGSSEALCLRFFKTWRFISMGLEFCRSAHAYDTAQKTRRSHAFGIRSSLVGGLNLPLHPAIGHVLHETHCLSSWTLDVLGRPF